MAETFHECFTGVARHATFASDAAECLRDGKRHEQIGESGRELREARPPMNPPHRVCLNRAQSMFVVVREELGFVRGHVDVDGTFAFASFA